MASHPTGFSSVKLPAALVQQAREAAQPLRRSVAGQGRTPKSARFAGSAQEAGACGQHQRGLASEYPHDG